MIPSADAMSTGGPSADALRALTALWTEVGADPGALRRVTLTGGDPILPGRFKVATAALASIGAAALAATELWRLRTGRAQTVSVDARAAAASYRSERYLRVDEAQPPDPWGKVSGYYRTGDDRFVQLHCNFPHHEAGVLEILRCGGTRNEVAVAVRGWTAVELEDALARPGM